MVWLQVQQLSLEVSLVCLRRVHVGGASAFATRIRGWEEGRVWFPLPDGGVRATSWCRGEDSQGTGQIARELSHQHPEWVFSARVTGRAEQTPCYRQGPDSGSQEVQRESENLHFSHLCNSRTKNGGIGKLIGNRSGCCRQPQPVPNPMRKIRSPHHIY